MDLSFSFRSQDHEVPRKAGGVSYGLSERPVAIQISGEFGVNASGATVTEQAMWTELGTLRTKLAAADDAERLELFLYYDNSGGGTYVKLKQVRPVTLQPTVGDSSRIVFGYSLTLIADDTSFYTTAPGS